MLPSEPRTAFLVFSRPPESGEPGAAFYELGREDCVVIAARDADINLAQAKGGRAKIAWDGHHARLLRAEGEVFLHGKLAQDRGVLQPGEELSIGEAKIVLGVVHQEETERRALTHLEFRERLYEEMARARRAGRPTSLVMLSTRAPDAASVLSRALDTFRAGDVVGTYGPCDIEILLPDSDKSHVQAVLARAALVQEILIGVAIAPAHGDSPERLMRSARAAVARAEAGELQFADAPKAESERAPRLVTVDPASQRLRATLLAIPEDASRVLLFGEVSSGKSAFARLLHTREGEGRFRIVHCGRVREVRDEHFCGAGTLVLDEIEQLSVDAQAKLLASLDVASPLLRVVATTQASLAQLVARGALLSELQTRFGGIEIEVPPLRQRPLDILPLARLFAHQAPLSLAAIARLRSQPWRGNVLELRNAIERALLLSADGEILAEHLPAHSVARPLDEGRLRVHVEDTERSAIAQALAECNHNQTRAAKKLGISRRALIYKMEKHGLKRPPRSTK